MEGRQCVFAPFQVVTEAGEVVLAFGNPTEVEGICTYEYCRRHRQGDLVRGDASGLHQSLSKWFTLPG